MGSGRPSLPSLLSLSSALVLWRAALEPRRVTAVASVVQSSALAPPSLSEGDILGLQLLLPYCALALLGLFPELL